MTMTSYQRKAKPFYRSNRPTQVTISWSQQYSAYALKYGDTGHFAEMTPINNFIKSTPYGEYTYDPDNKIWYFAEKHLGHVRMLLDAFGPSIFQVTFKEKPVVNNTFMSKVVSVDNYLDNFKKLTGEDISKLEYNEAKKIYRRMCMKFHPDKNPEFATIMSSINQIWTELELRHFKTRQEPVYETSGTS